MHHYCPTLLQHNLKKKEEVCKYIAICYFAEKNTVFDKKQ